MLKRNAFTWIELLVVIAILIMLAGLLFPQFAHQREYARCAKCKDNMKQIGIALQNYHEQYGSFPPPYTLDADGKPLHSWRILILPFFAEGVLEPKWKDVYEKIRFDEPWDSEYNTQFHERLDIPMTHDPDGGNPFYNNMPRVYGCPNSPNETTETVYQMIVGDRTSGQLHGVSLSKLKKKSEDVILVIEIWPPIPWMSPFDFQESDFETAVSRSDQASLHEAQEAQYDSKYEKRRVIGGDHGRELHILFADGTVKTYWDWKLPIQEIEIMSHIE